MPTYQEHWQTLIDAKSWFMRQSSSENLLVLAQPYLDQMIEHEAIAFFYDSVMDESIKTPSDFLVRLRRYSAPENIWSLINEQLDRLGMSSVLTREWSEEWGCVAIKDLPASVLPQYLEYLRKL